MKPLEIAGYVCNFGSSGILLDCFAGSGTAGHAIINLNREDNGNRKFILIEMGEYFDTCLLPRLKKVIYSPNWKQGKPEHFSGSTCLIKYIRLESYEDTLDNIELTQPKNNLLAKESQLSEDYQLRYAISEETAHSPCLLGGMFNNPFTYSLSVLRNGTRQETRVDLPETFNYLLGLSVNARRQIGAVLAISGKSQEKKCCLVLWRDLAVTDNAALEAWLRDCCSQFSTSFDFVYVNGDHTLNAGAIRHLGQSCVAKSIEPVFRELMFEGTDYEKQ